MVVHHAVEQQTLKRFPNAVSPEEIHSLENLRGIPVDKNASVHLSEIRKVWNDFYRRNLNPTKQDLLHQAGRIDKLFSNIFIR